MNKPQDKYYTKSIVSYTGRYVVSKLRQVVFLATKLSLKGNYRAKNSLQELVNAIQEDIDNMSSKIVLSGFDLSFDDSAMVVNSTNQLVVSNPLPDGATISTISYLSSDESLVTVDSSGLMTSYDTEGTTTITATDNDSGVSEEIQIRVVADIGRVYNPNSGSYTLSEGEPASLTCTADEDIVTFQWIKDGEFIQGETSLTISRESLLFGDSGVYFLRGFNEAGDSTDSATTALTVVQQDAVGESEKPSESVEVLRLTGVPSTREEADKTMSFADIMKALCGSKDALDFFGLSDTPKKIKKDLKTKQKLLDLLYEDEE